LEAYICITCGTQFPPTEQAPLSCPTCLDDRQYVNQAGQQWTTLREMKSKYGNVLDENGFGITGIRPEPVFAIGQQAHLIQTNTGNILWDCISYLDEKTKTLIKERGGLKAIAISHPHFFSSMIDWSRAFDNAPIYLHAQHQPWVMRPDERIRYWDGDTIEVLPDLTLIRCGGHFPGSSVLHWSGGNGGKGVLFTSDTLTVVSDQRYVSFMYSYPNLILLSANTVRQIVAAVEPYAFDRIYGSWVGKIILTNAKQAVKESADRYIGHLGD
jgi:hypothetical protein